MANGTFIPGTGSLKSSTLVNAFLELSILIQTQERIASENEATVTANNLTVPNNVVLSADFDTDTVSVAIANLPITTSLISGNITIEAFDYLTPIQAVVPAVDASFTPTGSSLSKTDKVSALLELAQLIQNDEADLITPDNKLTMQINADTNTIAITAVFDMTPSLSSTGLIQISAINYLA